LFEIVILQAILNDFGTARGPYGAQVCMSVHLLNALYIILNTARDTEFKFLEVVD